MYDLLEATEIKCNESSGFSLLMQNGYFALNMCKTIGSMNLTDLGLNSKSSTYIDQILGSTKTKTQGLVDPFDCVESDHRLSEIVGQWDS